MNVRSFFEFMKSKALIHATGYTTHLVIHLTWRCTKYKSRNGISGNFNILEGTQNVNSMISNNDTRSCRVLNCIFCLTSLASNTTYRTGKMITMKHLDILNLKCIYKQIIQTQECNSILYIKTHCERTNKIRPFCQRTWVISSSMRFHFYTSTLMVEANMELHMIYQRSQNVFPLFLQRCVPMRRNANPSKLWSTIVDIFSTKGFKLQLLTAFDPVSIDRSTITWPNLFLIYHILNVTLKCLCVNLHISCVIEVVCLSELFYLQCTFAKKLTASYLYRAL
mmetsp:Transcript_19875/g.32689  ORF Transcript_19875/g.32689 Transcript_19875/m.32689 type:complete len:280 (-) Transcript_19875:4-843(-)